MLTAIFLITANLIPLFGVVYLRWSLNNILFIYWFENIVIGIYAILKILVSKRRIEHGVIVKTSSGTKEYKSKIAIIRFFVMHYGLFILGHGLFLTNTLRIPLFFIPTLVVPITGLFLSHGVSYVTHYLAKKEYEHMEVNKMMWLPYKRVIIMHGAVLLAAIFSLSADVINSIMLFALIFLKTVADLFSHVIEHRDNRNPTGSDS